MKYIFLFLVFISPLLYMHLGIQLSAQINLDSIEQLLPKKKGAAKVKLLSDLCWEYGSSNTIKAEKYGNQAINLAKKIKNDTLLALAYNDLGSLFLRIGDYPKAKEKYAQSISIREKLKDNIGLASVYSKLAVIEELQSNFSNALKMNIKVLKIYEKEGVDEIAIGTLYGNIAVILYNMNQLNDAIEYNKKAFKIGEKLKNHQIIGSAYGNYGSIASKKKEFQKSINYFKLSIESFLKINNQNAIASCYNNTGNAFSALNKIDSAALYYEKCLRIRTKINDRNGMLSLKTNLASLNNKLGKVDVALKYAHEALTESILYKTKDETKNIYRNLAESYKIKKDYENAYKYQNLYIQTKDSIYGDETTKQIAEMATKYESEKKENQILLLKKDKEVQKTENKRQKTLTIAFIFGFIIALLFTFFIVNRLRKIQIQNKIIEFQKNEVFAQKHLVEEKNREILDSITYAKRIQSAILPQPKLVKEFLEDSFILYKPKDIVAGDFYWLEVKKDIVLFAAADCTGHGVPGAMVSVVCNNGLNRAVREFGLIKPNEILDKTRELVIEEFEKSDEDVKDGMDISLCSLNLETKSLNWAGAHNPLWILRKNFQGLVEVLETKADKQPIGKFAYSKPFTNHEISLMKDDEIYISTDGFQDQFGGEKGKKFKASKMKEILVLNSQKTMQEKLNLLDEMFENWKGELEQVDDVCIIGIRI